MNDETTPVENAELEPVHVPISVNLTQEAYNGLRELGHVYGSRYARDIIARAIQDALAHAECSSQESENSGGKVPAWAAELQAELSALKSEKPSAKKSPNPGDEDKDEENEEGEGAASLSELPEIPQPVQAYANSQILKIQADVKEIMAGNVITRSNSWFPSEKGKKARRAFLAFIREPKGKESAQAHLDKTKKREKSK